MNLHPITGAAAAGNGGVGAWVEGVCLFPGPAGFPCWFGDRFGYQSAEGTIRSCLPDGSDDQLVDAGPGAPLLAAGGHWAAFDGQNTRTDWNLTLPGCAPLGMAPDGTLFVTTYQSQQDIQVIPPGAMAPALRLPDARPLVNLGSSRGHLLALSLVQFVWIDQSLTLRSYGFPAAPAQVDESARFPTVLSIDGRVILLYTTQSGRMVAHPYDDARNGWSVDGIGFGFTGRALQSGQIECRWATGDNNVGEVGPIARRAIDLATDVSVPLAPVPDPLPTIADVEYPCLVGFSWVPSGHAAPGNCQFLTQMSGEPVQDWRGMQDTSRPVFASADTIALNRPPALLGQIGTVEGAGPTYNYRDSAQFWAYLEGCAFYGTRPTFADDGEPSTYPRGILDRLPPWGLPMAECYPLPGELPSAALARLDAKVAQLLEDWPLVCGVVVPTYTQQGAWNKSAVLAILARVPTWIATAHGRLRVVWIFPRERGGIGGPLLDPDMLEMGNRLAAACMAKGSAVLMDVGEGQPQPTPTPIPSPVDPSPAPPPAPSPQPEPSEETDTMIVGQKGMFRPFDATTGRFVKATVAECQDSGFLSARLDEDAPEYGGAKAGEIAHFDVLTGAFAGSRPEPKGTGEERVTFDGKNLMVSRPGDLGHVALFTWVNL